MNEAHEQLFSRVCDGLATATEISELHRLLSTDAAALDAWLRYSALHGELAGGSALADARATDSYPALPFLRRRPDPDMIAPRRQNIWLQWRALAAGLVAGLFTATMVWSYIAPLRHHAVMLLEEQFESASVPLATRVALEPGIWRGDFAEIVGEQQGVRPEHGRRMLRFLGDDHDGKPKPAGGHIADVYRLIDLRPYRDEIADGGAVVQAAASFNAAPFPTDEKYGGAISVYALDAETLPDRAERIGTALTAESIAMARSNRTMLDREPATWQRLTTELRVPSHTEFLVIRLHLSQAFDSTHARFTGGYADDVNVALIRWAPLP